MVLLVDIPTLIAAVTAMITAMTTLVVALKTHKSVGEGNDKLDDIKENGTNGNGNSHV